DYWYSGYLGNLYLLALSGNMWTPEIVANQKTPLAQRRLQHDKSNPSIRYISKKDMMITGIHGVTSVNLMSLNGQILHRIKIVQTENGSISTIPDVRSGCYLLRVVSGNKTMMPVQMISVIE
ncbi:MAG: T9SS type A sorting domain-containing protein, partial [Fibrobacter sp.]|nr:T9SS type A sorting domain-containing protein [Fibrobacter sp.]